MRFIGSKRLLLKNIEYTIIQNIKDFDKLSVFCDVFSGTSIVAQYFKKKYSIISNDLLYFSYVIQKTYIETNEVPQFKKIPDHIGDPISYFNKLENKHLTSGFVINNFSPSGKDKRMYLSEINAKRIDTIRDTLDKWKLDKLINQNEYFYLLCSLIESVPFVSNIAGTYGAYLKNWDKRSFKDIKLLNPIIYNNNKKNFSYNEDANKLIRKISGDILYIDPPYNARQYLPNYHLLETIAKYDNPKIKGKTGIREYNAEKSDYCSKRLVSEKFEDLVNNADFKYIIVSYNNEGLIPEDILDKIIKKFSFKIYKKYRYPYRRYKKDAKIAEHDLHELIYIIDKK